MKYGVKVIYTYSVDKKKYYEEQILCVNAESFDDAYKKAEEYTSDMDLEHINPNGKKVTIEKIDFVDCFLAFDEENGVQEIYSSFVTNKSELNEESFYKVLTEMCDVEDLKELRYEEFN